MRISTGSLGSAGRRRRFARRGRVGSRGHPVRRAHRLGEAHRAKPRLGTEVPTDAAREGRRRARLRTTGLDPKPRALRLPPPRRRRVHELDQGLDDGHRWIVARPAGRGPPRPRKSENGAPADFEKPPAIVNVPGGDSESPATNGSVASGVSAVARTFIVHPCVEPTRTVRTMERCYPIEPWQLVLLWVPPPAKCGHGP
jgi:hypothetical protein